MLLYRSGLISPSLAGLGSSDDDLGISYWVFRLDAGYNLCNRRQS